MADDRTMREPERFLADRADQLMRTAVLLTGSRDAGQDLLQTALERIIRHWRSLDGDPEAYLRTTSSAGLTAGASGRRPGRPVLRRRAGAGAARVLWEDLRACGGSARTDPEDGC